MDLATCLVQGSGVMLVVSPGQAAPLAARLQKYVLYGDQVRRALKQLQVLRIHSGLRP